MISARMALPKDAKHDFYALATGEISPGEQGLNAAELWPEAVFFIAAGAIKILISLHVALTISPLSCAKSVILFRWRYS